MLGGPQEDKPGKSRIEAFCWGGLTSRASWQALWLLLLPFSLVNIAHWMILPYRHKDGEWTAGGSSRYSRPVSFERWL